MNATTQSFAEQHENRRRSERFHADRTTTVTLLAGGQHYRCSLEDLSYGGMRIRFDESIPKCRAVVLEHDFVGRLHGSAAWQDKSTMGIELQVIEGDLEHSLQCVGLLVSPDGAPPREPDAEPRT